MYLLQSDTLKFCVFCGTLNASEPHLNVTHFESLARSGCSNCSMAFPLISFTYFQDHFTYVRA